MKKMMLMSMICLVSGAVWAQNANNFISDVVYNEYYNYVTYAKLSDGQGNDCNLAFAKNTSGKPQWTNCGEYSVKVKFKRNSGWTRKGVFVFSIYGLGESEPFKTIRIASQNCTIAQKEPIKYNGPSLSNL